MSRGASAPICLLVAAGTASLAGAPSVSGALLALAVPVTAAVALLWLDAAVRTGQGIRTGAACRQGASVALVLLAAASHGRLSGAALVVSLAVLALPLAARRPRPLEAVA